MMHGEMNRVLAGFVFLGLALPVCGQGGGGRMGGGRDGGVMRARVEPYTAEFKITHVQRLADGTTITRVTKEVDARDSQRRTLRETTESVPWQGRPAGTEGIVRDPGGGWTDWLSWSHTASVIESPPPDQRHGCWADNVGSVLRNYDRMRIPRPVTTEPSTPPVPPEFDDLGLTWIDGFEAQGTRTTRTIPTGQIGNSEPLVTTTETWRSPRLGLVPRQIADDPQDGKTTRELASLTVGEPDAALFQPPAGYKVKVIKLHQAPCPDVPR